MMIAIISPASLYHTCWLARKGPGASADTLICIIIIIIIIIIARKSPTASADTLLGPGRIRRAHPPTPPPTSGASADTLIGTFAVPYTACHSRRLSPL